MGETMINGCDTGSYSRMSKKCRNCDKREYCDHKKMEKLAYIIPSQATKGNTVNTVNTVNTAGAAGWTVAEVAAALDKALNEAAVQITELNEVRRG